MIPLTVSVMEDGHRFPTCHPHLIVLRGPGSLKFETIGNLKPKIQNSRTSLTPEMRVVPARGQDASVFDRQTKSEHVGIQLAFLGIVTPGVTRADPEVLVLFRQHFSRAGLARSVEPVRER